MRCNEAARGVVEVLWREWRLDAADAPDHARGYGSPTVLVDRRDVAGGEPSGCDSCCRLYPSADGAPTGAPSLEQLLDAIRGDAHNRSDAPSYTPVPEEREAVSAAWSDEVLMAAYQNGNARAFELLFERYQDRLYGYFVRRLGDRELAADMFQRAFLRVHRARKRCDPKRSVATWVFGIASNLGKDELKRRARRPGDVYWAVPEDAPPSATTRTPERLLLSKVQARGLEDALAALPDSQREVIVLHRWRGSRSPRSPRRSARRWRR